MKFKGSNVQSLATAFGLLGKPAILNSRACARRIEGRAGGSKEELELLNFEQRLVDKP